MQSYRRHLTLITAALLLAACDTEPVAPTSRSAPPATFPRTASNAVERTTEEHISSFDGSFTKFFCDDGTESELVALEGQIFYRNSVTYGPTGSIHMTSHAMPIGLRGVGTVTGQEYRVKEQEHAAVSQREAGYAGTLRQGFVLTATESMQTFKLVTVSHYVVTPAGELVVEREQVRTECAK